MKQATKDKLYIAWQYCDDEDKSTEFMIEYMKDAANVSHDTVMNFICNHGDEQRTRWIKTHQDLLK